METGSGARSISRAMSIMLAGLATSEQAAARKLAVRCPTMGRITWTLLLRNADFPAPGVLGGAQAQLFLAGLRVAQRLEAVEAARVELERVQHLLAQELGARGGVSSPLLMARVRKQLGSVFGGKAQLFPAVGI